FWVGHEGSYRLLRRYGRVIRLDERKLKLGQYLFLKRGGKVIFFGRYVAMLRAWAACLAGTERMAWPRFLVFNAAGDILWPTLYGLGGYAFGNNVHRLKLWHAPPTSLIIDTGRGKTVVLVAAAKWSHGRGMASAAAGINNKGRGEDTEPCSSIATRPRTSSPACRSWPPRRTLSC